MTIFNKTVLYLHQKNNLNYTKKSKIMKTKRKVSNQFSEDLKKAELQDLTINIVAQIKLAKEALELNQKMYKQDEITIEVFLKANREWNCEIDMLIIAYKKYNDKLRQI